MGTVGKPSLDLFKAIFLDSDSDSDEEDQKGEKEEEEEADKMTAEEATSKALYLGRELAPKVPPKPWEEKKQNLLRNTDPARGIFANIDFDALNKKKAASEPEKVDKKVNEKNDNSSDKDRDKPYQRMILNSLGSKPKDPGDRNISADGNTGRRNASDYFKKGDEDNSSSDSDDYGPALPPKPLGKSGGESIVISSDSESEKWKVKKKKKKDKKKKKKHRKEKKGSKRDSD